MSAIVCMGLLFGTKRTLNDVLAEDCVTFAKLLYKKL